MFKDPSIISAIIGGIFVVAAALIALIPQIRLWLEERRDKERQRIRDDYLRVLARSELREIAVRELKARGPRMDAVSYLLDAMRLFRGKSLQEIQEITFEIGILGKYGLDINDPQESHVLRALPGRVFSALQLICIMYAGFKRIEPGMDIGVDLGEEWGMAERVGGEGEEESRESAA
jgi:hypothetical protein